MLGKHKLLFSFHLTLTLEQSRGNLTQEEVDFFTKGNASVANCERISPVRWIIAEVS
jgi:dynein heavy chain